MKDHRQLKFLLFGEREPGLDGLDGQRLTVCEHHILDEFGSVEVLGEPKHIYDVSAQKFVAKRHLLCRPFEGLHVVLLSSAPWHLD